MSTNEPGTNAPGSNPPPDWRELRRQERSQRHAYRDELRAQRRAWRGNSAWVVGAILIVLGIVLMLQNLGAFTLQNWWALFILIPALGALAGAWNGFTQNGGQFTPAVIGPLVTGLILAAVTAAFLFELNWGLFGSIVLILIGVAALVGTLAWRG